MRNPEISMAPFTQSEINSNWPLYDLFQNGGVVLFKRRDYLSDTIFQLKEVNYQIKTINSLEHSSIEAILESIVKALVPIGPNTRINPNLDSFDDFLFDIEFKGKKGVILVLDHFPTFYKMHRKQAITTINILAQHHRAHLLKGNRFLTIIQSDNPRIDEKIGLVGGYIPIWNRNEWFAKSRGL